MVHHAPALRRSLEGPAAAPPRRIWLPRAPIATHEVAIALIPPAAMSATSFTLKTIGSSSYTPLQVIRVSLCHTVHSESAGAGGQTPARCFMA